MDHAYSTLPLSWYLSSLYEQTLDYLDTKLKGTPYLMVSQLIPSRYLSKLASEPRQDSNRHSSLKFVFPVPNSRIFKQGLRWSCSPSCALSHQGRQWSVLLGLTRLGERCGSTHSWTQLYTQGSSTQKWQEFLEYKFWNLKCWFDERCWALPTGWNLLTHSLAPVCSSVTSKASVSTLSWPHVDTYTRNGWKE